MKLQITELAAVKLRRILWEETLETPLSIRVVLFTSGCSTPSFGLEIIEQKDEYRSMKIHNLPIVWYPEDEIWLNDISIDVNLENGKFIIEHPDPKLLTNCPMNLQGDDEYQDE